jgi:hypothetical protein
VILLSVIYEEVMNWNTIYFLTVHYSLFDPSLTIPSAVPNIDCYLLYFYRAMLRATSFQSFQSFKFPRRNHDMTLTGTISLLAITTHHLISGK